MIQDDIGVSVSAGLLIADYSIHRRYDNSVLTVEGKGGRLQVISEREVGEQGEGEVVEGEKKKKRRMREMGKRSRKRRINLYDTLSISVLNEHTDTNRKTHTHTNGGRERQTATKMDAQTDEHSSFSD